MSQLLETIKLENGRLFDLEYHNRRMNAARRELFGTLPPVDLADIIQVPEECCDGLYRCRIVYSNQIESIEFIPQKERTFSSLKLVVCDHLDYHLKYANRSLLNELYAQRGEADEIIIVRNNEITDCSIGNLLFYDGESWVTPADPLLQGTQRQKLLETGHIQEEFIVVQDLKNYSKVAIINTFFDLKNMPIIEIENIF
ncbi:aminotransferase class IV family protein [Mangrovibacterium diazotrophicum]|uniref:4-amino-4-deoxychorismate lyase n=1 Tax=Mangrovibacterium diazotrophicum TaxID=1261403 RepID=A0A419VYZ2_9BACT|nr:aminotransferase class IV family protein [Mangrovibacterium diazotrophicum]RKD88458.1 4-amino-4-deoxychorismate lyase [Mangrovibacterium diazotrophicum]